MNTPLNEEKKYPYVDEMKERIIKKKMFNGHHISQRHLMELM